MAAGTEPSHELESFHRVDPAPEFSEDGSEDNIHDRPWQNIHDSEDGTDYNAPQTACTVDDQSEGDSNARNLTLENTRDAELYDSVNAVETHGLSGRT